MDVLGGLRGVSFFAFFSSSKSRITGGPSRAKKTMPGRSNCARAESRLYYRLARHQLPKISFFVPVARGPSLLPFPNFTRLLIIDQLGSRAAAGLPRSPPLSSSHRERRACIYIDARTCRLFSVSLSPSNSYFARCRELEGERARAGTKESGRARAVGKFPLLCFHLESDASRRIAPP